MLLQERRIILGNGIVIQGNTLIITKGVEVTQGDNELYLGG